MAVPALKAGNVAVITGAGSGIGRAAARIMAAKGMKVVLSDVDAASLQEALAEVQGLCAGGAGDAISCVCDVADEGAVKKLKEECWEAFGGCHLLMANAAKMPMNGSCLAPMPQITSALNVNLMGQIHTCQAFIPAMQEAGTEGQIIITGSKQGITMPPSNFVYNMTKAAVKCYAEGLQHELRNKEGNKLRVCLLVPGWTNTGIVANGLKSVAAAEGKEFDPDKVPFSEGKPAKGAWMPAQVVEYMVSTLEKDNDMFYIICPDNEVDEKTDNLRMAWTGQEIVERRPPLSRWHADWKGKFEEYMAKNK